MTLGRTESGAIKIKTDTAGGGLRAVECGCCTSCPPIETQYNVISEAMYNALRAGGNYVANGTLYEPNYIPYGSQSPCNMSASESGIISSGNCGASIRVQQTTCGGSFAYDAYIRFVYSIAKVGDEYRFTYGGGSFDAAWCPYDVTQLGSFPCYSVGYSVGWVFDNIPQGPIFCSIAGGGITLNTSAGTLGPFGIYTFCGVGSSGSLDITITPFS
jgi:hypothetical protein